MASAPNLTDRQTIAGGLLFVSFSLPVYPLLILFWLPMMIIQFKAFFKGFMPYPKKAKWFCILIGAIPALVMSVIFDPEIALAREAVPCF